MKYAYISLVLLLTGFTSLASAAFIDVDVTHPNISAISGLEQLEVIQGERREGHTYFHPLRPVNRAEALKITLLSSDTTIHQEQIVDFVDVPVNAWYTDIVATGVQRGIVAGYNDNTFRPGNTVTRAELLVMAARTHAIKPEHETEDWWAFYMAWAEALRLIDDRGVDPHEELTRAQVAEILYRLRKVSEHNFQLPYVYSGQGLASYYHPSLAFNLTANGEKYDPQALTVAHRTLPFDTMLTITHGDASVVARVNDRGPYHENRVLDLSEAVFEALAPKSRGVIDVEFELYTEETQENIAIPNAISQALTEETQDMLLLPETVKQELDPDASHINYEYKPPAYYPTSTGYINTEFFEGVTLRNRFPQTVYEGSVLLISGRAEENHTTATIFLESETTGEQVFFDGPLSGFNFAIPVIFDRPGVWNMGLVFDEATRSKVATITVQPQPRERKFIDPDGLLLNDSTLTVTPDPIEKRVVLEWDKAPKTIHRIVFTQTQPERKYRRLDIESSVSVVSLPYSFFNAFAVGGIFTIDLQHAASEDGTLPQQISNWHTADTMSYRLQRGFPDTTKPDKLAMDYFVKAITPTGALVHTKNESTHFDVMQHDIIVKAIPKGDTVLNPEAYITYPDGFVDSITLEQAEGVYQATVTPKDAGLYVIELLSDQGEVLFNRGVYVQNSDEYMPLPVLPWRYTPFAYAQTQHGTLQWINEVRAAMGLKGLELDPQLITVAQQYAEEMAAGQFISHVSPRGRTLKDRLHAAGVTLSGTFGENLAVSTDFGLGLGGLETSGSHRQNILNPRWTKAGIGIAVQGEKIYIVQIFTE